MTAEGPDHGVLSGGTHSEDDDLQVIKDDGYWLDAARRCRSPNQDERPPGMEITLLVVHNISLPPGCFGGRYVEDLFLNQLDPRAHAYFEGIASMRVSAHLFIDRKGNITQYVPFEQRAWHAGQSSFEGRVRCNDYSIGIELEGTDDREFSELQYLRLLKVARAIMQAYPGISPQRVVGHSDIAPGRKTDPGPKFDWKRVQSGLRTHHFRGLVARNSSN